jgi:hypothetical protein
MTNLYARDYEYEGWSVDDGAKMLKQAVGLVKRHMFCGVSVMFGQVEFSQMAPPNWADTFGSIYTSACQLVLRVTAFWMDERHCFDPIAYHFENGHRFWDQANATLRALDQQPELKRMYRYRSHTAIDKVKSFGLQAADMLAWIMGRAEVGFARNHTMRAFAPIIMELPRGDSAKYQLFHPSGDLLQRFFDLNMEEQHKVVLTLSKPWQPVLR